MKNPRSRSPFLEILENENVLGLQNHFLLTLYLKNEVVYRHETLQEWKLCPY